jgi:hypothetical protein
MRAFEPSGMKSFLFALIFVPFCLKAQNGGKDTLKTASDTLKWKADLSLTGIYQGGNVEALIFRAKANVRYRPSEKWSFQTTNSYVYQEFGKEKADEDVLSLNFLYFKPERRLHPLLLAFVSTNFRRKIDLRYLLGGGIAYQVLDKNGNWLKVALTSEYERTNFNEDDFNLEEYDGYRSINTLRSTIWLNGKYYLFKKKVIFSHENYYQPSLLKGNNYRWQADLSLDFPIWEFLSFKINYRHTSESVVIASQQKEDRFLTVGFTLKNY